MPFRWDVARREQLGSLPLGEEAPSYPGFEAELRTCCARVVSAGQNSDFVFIGRSPESIFDYLSGAFAETSWNDRLSLLNLSLRYTDSAELKIGSGPDVHVLRRHIAALGLAPDQIATRPRPVVLVDLVADGTTLGAVTGALTEWAADERVDVNALRRRIRFVGIVWRRKTSPNTWRWNQHAEWLEPFGRAVVKNVSIPGTLWDYLGNKQSKVSRTQPISKWQNDEWRFEPPRDAENLESLRLALRIYNHAGTAQDREQFSRELAEQPAVSESWLRTLIGELRKTA